MQQLCAQIGVQPIEPKVGVVIPSLNAGSKWAACLDAIDAQSFKPLRKLLIDSASTDETTSMAKAAGFEIIGIERSQFNHGGTRQWAAERLPDCEIIIFLTQDAILAQIDTLQNLVACFKDPTVACAYGRQLPHVGAGAIEAHARWFNYGTETVRKDIAMSARIGAKVFFCSNSFAAYNRKILFEVGGFRRDLILGEDMEFAARAIDAGYANVYCASAPVFHSHGYTIRQTLARYFDIGVFDSTVPWLRSRFGSHGGEGRRFVQSELRYLWSHNKLSIPHSMLQSAAKLLGYRLGRAQQTLSPAIKRRLSMMPSFWN